MDIVDYVYWKEMTTFAEMVDSLLKTSVLQ